MRPSRPRLDTSSSTLAGPSSDKCSLSTALAARNQQGSCSSTSASSSKTGTDSEPVPPKPSSSSRAAGKRLSWSSVEASSGDEGGAKEFVLAMHTFEPQGQNVTCLSFKAGQIIRVLNRDNSGWWDGQVDGRRGWFPSNYVTSDVGLLTEEELPKLTRSQPGHTHSVSVASAASWTTPASEGDLPQQQSFSRTDHRPIPSKNSTASSDTFCPALMVPLLHGLSLLQNAAKLARVAHFQPSTAYIISCVRAILSNVNCLARDAPILKRHGILGQERKRVLSDLALLVSQARRASEDFADDDLREPEIESMVRIGGQLFAHVRGFLALYVQCEGPLPAPGGRPGESTLGSLSGDRWLASEGTAVESEVGTTPPRSLGKSWNGPGKTANGIARRSTAKPRHTETHLATPLRAKSMGDLRSRKAIDVDVSTMPVLHYGSLGRKPSQQHSVTPKAKRLLDGSIAHHKPGQPSTSSQSSSSLSSGDSVATPVTPAFPSGPSTTAEVMEALRFAHDHYLSTIAAFIGHAHSHSRTSHASSMGHLYDLVREVVEMVCKLLTIVEAVLKHPEVPAPKAVNLKVAKENLYNVTSKLADSVRLLTMEPSPDVSEEEEKATLLRCATSALKAGSDCVASVKKCLQRSTKERPFIIQLPSMEDRNFSYSPRNFSQNPFGQTYGSSKTSSLHALRDLYASSGIDEGDEDITIHAANLSSMDATIKVERWSSDSLSKGELSNPWQESQPDANSQATHSLFLPPTSGKPLPPLCIPTESVSSALPSPVSTTQTEDDRTTWDSGSQHRVGSPVSFEEKVLHGALPPVPGPGKPEQPRSTPVAWTLTHDYAADDIAYNGEGQLVGATLAALVERMTPHDAPVEQSFASVFFLTFRLFTSPGELMDAVIARYNINPPPNLSVDDEYFWQQHKGIPVRLRVSNFLKTWLETYWRPATDSVVLPTLLSFTREALAIMFSVPSQRILELIRQWQISGDVGAGGKMERVRDAGLPLNPPSAPASEIPRPIMTKTLLNALRNKNYGSISVTDFDAMELARQLTTMECTLYCAIKPEEVLETGQEGAAYPVNVKAVTSLSTAITGFVAESILNELDTKKRTALVKFFIKVADRCVTLNNFSTPRSILAALDSSTISRLQQTWMGLSQKNKVQLESLRKLADHARNYHEYRSRLRNTAPPAVPFLGLYLTDVTFCREGNPSHRASPKTPDKKLLNFNKYHKLARIVQDMQRFQTLYNLKQIPEAQEFLKDAFEKSRTRGDLHDLYRRSLLVEPKQPADSPPTSDMRQLFNWTHRSQSNHSATTTA